MKVNIFRYSSINYNENKVVCATVILLLQRTSVFLCIVKIYTYQAGLSLYENDEMYTSGCFSKITSSFNVNSITIIIILLKIFITYDVCVGWLPLSYVYLWILLWGVGVVLASDDIPSGYRVTLIYVCRDLFSCSYRCHSKCNCVYRLYLSRQI